MSISTTTNASFLPHLYPSNLIVSGHSTRTQWKPPILPDPVNEKYIWTPFPDFFDDQVSCNENYGKEYQIENKRTPEVLYKTKTNADLEYERWKIKEHFWNYLVGYNLDAIGKFYIRMVDPKLSENILYNSEGIVGNWLTSTFAYTGKFLNIFSTESNHDVEKDLYSSSSNIYYTELGNNFETLASGIRVFFQLFNIQNYTRNTFRSWTENKTIAFASGGNAIKSAGVILERSSIISAGILYNTGFTQLSLTPYLSINPLNSLMLTHLALISTYSTFTLFNIPLGYREVKKLFRGESTDGVFMETLMATGSAISKVTLSVYTLMLFTSVAGYNSLSETVYYALKPENSLDVLDQQFKILKQSFATDQTAFGIALSAMLLTSGLCFVSQTKNLINSFSVANSESQPYSQKPVAIALFGASILNIAAVPFLANTAYLPVGYAISGVATLFFIYSVLYQHKKAAIPNKALS